MAGIGAVRRVAEERALGGAIRQCIGLPHVHMRFIYSLREVWSRRPGYTTPDSRPWSGAMSRDEGDENEDELREARLKEQVRWSVECAGCPSRRGREEGDVEQLDCYT